VPRRPDFDPKRPLVAARGFIFAGVHFERGDKFPPDGGDFPLRLIKRQYEARVVNHPEEGESEESLVTMTGPAGGRYKIDAPWFDKPITVRGKVNAEEAFAEIQEEGPPVDWTEGDSEVTAEEVGGGWFHIKAPWLDEPEKVQGRDEARALFLSIHAKGAPVQEAEVEPVDGIAASVLVSDDDGKFSVHAPWLDDPEEFDDAKKAELRQFELRGAGPPEGWEPPAEDAGTSENDAAATS